MRLATERGERSLGAASGAWHVDADPSPSATAPQATRLEIEPPAADLIASYERSGASCVYDCIPTSAPYCDEEGRCRVDPIDP